MSSAPVTEICYITLKPGLDIDGDTPARKVLRDSLKTASEQEGFERFYFGKQLEDENVVMVLIDWKSLPSKNIFLASPAYKTFVSTLLEIAASLRLYHVELTPFPPLLLAKAPCIEFVTIYGCTPTFFEQLKVFSKAIVEGKPEGFWGAVLGEVVEEIARGGGEGGKGRAVVLWFGWDNEDAHMRFRETRLFADNIGLLRTGCESKEMFHVSLQTTM